MIEYKRDDMFTFERELKPEHFQARACRAGRVLGAVPQSYASPTPPTPCALVADLSASRPDTASP